MKFYLKVPGPSMAPPSGNLSRRRGSDRSLSGSAHELAVSACMKDGASKVPHSHSQSNLSDTPYRLVGKCYELPKKIFRLSDQTNVRTYSFWYKQLKSLKENWNEIRSFWFIFWRFFFDFFLYIFLSVVIYRGDMPSPEVSLPATTDDPKLTSTATGVHDAYLKNP